MRETGEKPLLPRCRQEEKNEVMLIVLAVVPDDVEPRCTPVGWLFHASSDNIFLAFS